MAGFIEDTVLLQRSFRQDIDILRPSTHSLFLTPIPLSFANERRDTKVGTVLVYILTSAFHFSTRTFNIDLTVSPEKTVFRVSLIYFFQHPRYTEHRN